MAVVASTPFYTISVDSVKNRMSLKVKGSWLKDSEVPTFLDDIRKGLDKCSPGFTIFMDVSEMGGTFLPDVLAEAQKMAIQAGVKKVGSVYEKETFFKMQAEQIAQKTGFPVKRFGKVQDAEAWLDEP